MDQSALALPVALLEREHEIERIRGTLRAAGHRVGGALIIEGAGGMGKSRLLDEARLRAQGVGVRVLTARATELEQGFPFGVVRQLFERPLLRGRRRRARALADGRGSAGRGSPRPAPTTASSTRAAGPRPAIPATRGTTACTGWPRTSPAIRRSRWWWTIFSGATRRRLARLRSSRADSRGSRSRSSLRPVRSIPL